LIRTEARRHFWCKSWIRPSLSTSPSERLTTQTAITTGIHSPSHPRNPSLTKTSLINTDAPNRALFYWMLDMPAIQVQDLYNAKLDADHIAEIATSLESTATDRKGNVKRTVKGAIDTIMQF